MNKQTIIISPQIEIDIFNIENNGNGFEFAVYYLDDIDGYSRSNFINGIARYDGIRHLYFGHNPTSDQEEVFYMYYPNLGELKLVYDKLHELEVKYGNSCVSHYKNCGCKI